MPHQVGELLWSQLVDSQKPLVITAIRDTDQESFIASALTRIGRLVIYRATTAQALGDALMQYPRAILFISDDFAVLENFDQVEKIALKGRARPLGQAALHNPTTDLEIEELLNAIDKSQLTPVRSLPLLPQTTFALFSIGRNVGTTATAISVADSISQGGRSTLLLDCNIDAPQLSHHFQIHNIRDEIARTSFGFDLYEISEISNLYGLTGKIEKYESVVIDMGQAISRPGEGRRVGDLLHRWVRGARCHQVICLRDDEKSLAELSFFISRERDYRPDQNFSLILIPRKLLAKRERIKLIERYSEQLGVSVEVLSRDSRSIERAQAQNSTLSITAPKSPLVGEIARYLKEGRYS